MSRIDDIIAGKTIVRGTLMKRQEYDDEPYLHLEFSDGSDACVVASYGGYTGGSEDEYPAFISVMADRPTPYFDDDEPFNLVEVIEEAAE